MTTIDAGPADPRAHGIAAPFYALLYLPGGMAQGFVQVTLAYMLAQHGVSVAAIGAVVALFALPHTWKFVAGPMIDASLSSPVWYAMSIVVGVACMIGFAVVPLTMAYLPVISLLTLATSIAFTVAGSATTAAMAATTPVERRGAAAGWVQTGNLGGVGAGGGLALWVYSHLGGQIAAAGVIAGLCVLAALPMLLMRVPSREAAHNATARIVGLSKALWAVIRTREGVMAALLVSIPAALGAATSLLAAVAGDWKAPADLVALVLGVGSGVASVPGCVLGGYLADRFPRRAVYVGSAAACALGQVAMALAPHNPFTFTGFVLFNAVLLGVAWSSVNAVIYEQLGPKAAATLASVFSSLCNVPVAIGTVVVASAQARHGSTGMLLLEAALALASITAYMLLAWLWKPSPDSVPLGKLAVA